MEKRKTFNVIFIVILCVSLVMNAVLLFGSFKIYNEFRECKKLKEENSKTLIFAEMFIKKVLMAEQDINFDTRLELETAVRNLNDNEVLDQWQKFTKSSDKDAASSEVKNLLDMLVKKAAN